jgi:kexin
VSTARASIDAPAEEQAQAPRQVAARADGADLLFDRQWHLKNTGQAGANGAVALAGEDINVEPVWSGCNDNGTCKGEGITVAVVDDGVEIAHEDLQANISSLLQHRVYSTTSAPLNGDPTPPLGTPELERGRAHGTSVAGTIAARDNNVVGGRGVAPRASLLGYRLTGGGITDSNEADAMIFQAANVHISNNSWGAPDNGHPFPATQQWQNAILQGLQNGRNGRGTIYVWANGNGGRRNDMSNYDGQANYWGVIAVGSVTAAGKRAVYSERGANLWVSAPGGDSCGTGLGITTTDLSAGRGANAGTDNVDLPYGSYTQCFDGTSASAPIASGVIALMLQANPSLSWRDVSSILARTARKTDPSDPGWTSNTAGHRINDAYGFGVVNAAAAVTAARTWANLPPYKIASGTQQVNLAIPDNNATGVTGSIAIADSGIRNIEWVDVFFNAKDHPYSADLEIVLVAPGGTRSILAETHLCLENSTTGQSPQSAETCAPYNVWRFGVGRHLDEPADGTWRLEVKDKNAVDTGTFIDWTIAIYGH